jgi:putative oxidoreductase
MRRLLSTKYSAGAFNAATLLLRLVFGGVMMHHGYQKLVGFGTMKNNFMNFMGIGSGMSLALVVFAEFFCALFLILGLFTRFAAIVLIICMAVAFFMAHKGVIFGEHGGETALLYLAGYAVLLFIGPGKISVDSLIGK